MDGVNNGVYAGAVPRNSRLTDQANVIRLLAFLLLALNASAVIRVDSMNLFTNGTAGSVITDAALNASKKGLGSWANNSGLNTPYVAWYVKSNASVAFPSPVWINGEAYPETGTNWLVWTNSETEGLESMGFQLPGGSGGTFSNLVLRLFMRIANTNSTSTGNNLDHVEIDGNPFCICQQETGSGNYRVKSHTGGVGGSAFNLTTSGRLFFVVVRDEAIAQTCQVTFYDAQNSFALVGTSTGSMNGLGNVWWVRLQALYAQLGDITGFTEIAGVTMDWTDLGPDLGGVTATIGSAVIGNAVIGE